MKILFTLFLFLLYFIRPSFILSQLSGSYVIGSGGDYITIQAAITDLESEGVSGPVTFNIKNGTYNEQVIIDSIAGVSLINRITFRSQSGNKSDVMWITNTPGSPPIVQINGAEYLSFEDLTIDATIFPFGTLARCIIFQKPSRGISVTDCRLNANFYGKPFYSDYFIGDLKITGNEFSTQDNSIEIAEVDNAEFINNSTSGNTGIEIKKQSNGKIIITGNRTYSQGAVGNFPTGVWLKNCNGTLILNKNILLTNYMIVSPTYAIRLYDCSFDSTLISNNFLGSVTEIDSCTNINFYFNTCRFFEKVIFLNNGNERGIDFAILSVFHSQNIRVLNNLFAPQLFPSFSNEYNTSVISDHNIYHIPDPSDFSPYFAYFDGTGYSDMTLYRAAANTDHNTKLKDAEFVSETDFHLAGASVGDTDLVGIPLTEVPDDIDGHIRNPLYPYIGADEADVPLPVVMRSFTYKIDRNMVTLYWSTIYEDNNRGFDIERSELKGDYIKVGGIEGAGTSFFIQNYEYTDRLQSPGTYHYRLKQIDFNGNYRYYNLNADVIAGRPGTYQVSQNYPNPFNPLTKINFELLDDQNVSLKIFDITGREVMKVLNDKFYTAGFYTIEVNAEKLSSGVYYYEMKAGEFRDMKRMMLIK